MALLHRMSEECIKSELDLFTVPLTQTAIEKNTYVEIPPLSAISDTGPLEFFIAGHGEDYTDLNNTLLYLRLKITKPDGSDRRWSSCGADKLPWSYNIFTGRHIHR